jgi:mannose-6-phosphate isomerase-like protein (cupin superfamily)
MEDALFYRVAPKFSDFFICRLSRVRQKFVEIETSLFRARISRGRDASCRAAVELIDEKSLSDACPHRWYNQTLCTVNDSVVRLGVVEGEYHWHKHDNEDEFFYVIEGKLSIDMRDRSVELGPRQAVVIPQGTVHRTRVRQRTVMLMVETASILPTGNP